MVWFVFSLFSLQVVLFRLTENCAELFGIEEAESTNAHRGDGKRFVVHADEKLTAFLELESAIS